MKAETKICIEEYANRRAWLIKAIAGALRHYALNPNKRAGDEEDMAVLAELLAELATAYEE